MKIIAVCAEKGGVGKTTLALNLAVLAALAGRRVWLVDADPQGSATMALNERAQAERQPTIPTAAYRDEAALKANLIAQRGNFDLIIVDVGGRDSRALRVTMGQADTVLVPFQPRSLDVWPLAHMAELVEDLRDAGKVLDAFCVLNLADVQGTDNKDAAAAAAGFPALTYLDTPIRRRKAFANAAGAGLGVVELEPVDLKAKAEIEALGAIVLGEAV